MASEKDLKWAVEVVETLRKEAQPGQYGSVTFQFLNGELVGAEVKHTYKPPVDPKRGGS